MHLRVVFTATPQNKHVEQKSEFGNLKNRTVTQTEVKELHTKLMSKGMRLVLSWWHVAQLFFFPCIFWIPNSVRAT